ncbi:MAG: hypothetical protein R3B74_17540, partial [Nitrospirales bacterium]|nr:hypothetical protein [Nitrospirales bacterium]
MRYLHWFNVDRNIVLGLILSLPVLMGSTCNSTVVEGPTGPERLPDSLLYPSQANAVAFSESSEGTFWPQILLVAASQNELWYSQWWDVRPGKSRKGGWSEWFRMGNPTGVDPFNNWNKNMPLVPWKDENDHRRVNGFFQYIDNQVNSRLGAHWWDYPNSPPHRFDTHPSGTQPFSPLTGTAWNFFHTPRLNFFGVIATGNNRNSLMEYWWSGTDWRWTDHGRPTGNIERSRIGNQSVVITKGDRIQETFLFITGDDFGGLSVEIRLYLRYHHGEDKPNWAWKDLGKPDNTNRMLEPLVLSHLDQATGRTNINVFVSAFNTDLGRWQLYERFWNGSGDWDEWEDWKLWGEPPLLQEDYPDKTS